MDEIEEGAKPEGRIPLTGNPGCFQKGNVGGPGRPKGSRNKLQESFLDALYKDFTANGEAAIKAMRENDPAAYSRVIASLVAKESVVDVTIREVESLSDEQARHMAEEFLARAARTERVG
jgi:hypothetical protein